MLSTNFITAQILGIISSFFLCISYIVKNKKHFLLFSILGDIIYATSFLFVNSVGTAIITFLSCLQTLCFYYFEIKNEKLPIWIAFLFILCFIVVGVVNLNTIWDVLPIVVYIYYTFTLYNKDLNKLKLMFIIANIILVIYDVLVTAYTNALEDFFEATFLIIILTTDYLKKIKTESANP